jgi:hypothetical protein
MARVLALSIVVAAIAACARAQDLTALLPPGVRLVHDERVMDIVLVP